METDNHASQPPAHRPNRTGTPPRPLQPMNHRPTVDGFAPRRPQPSPSASAPAPQLRPAAPALRPDVPDRTTPGPRPEAARPQPQAAARHTTSAGFVAARSAEPMRRTAESPPPAGSMPDMPKPGTAKPPKEHSSTGHAGLLGFAVFVVLGTLLLSPFIPGKIVENFPLSSENTSSGGQILSCIGTEGQISERTQYSTRIGSPLRYAYSRSVTQSATCDGRSQSAVTDRTSQFSPLALVTDALAALAAAIIFARIWRLIFGEKRHRR